MPYPAYMEGSIRKLEATRGRRMREEVHKVTLELMANLLSRLSTREREAFLLAYEKMSEEIESL